MTTGLDIVTDALEKLGVYAPGETLTDADAERGLTCLNDMLDSWSNESLSCYAILEQSTTLVVGQNAYTIGTSGGANINATRPLRIIEGPGAAYIQDTNSNNYFMDVLPRDQWNLIGNRGSTITSNVPDKLFYDPQFPLGIINIFPTPNISYTLFWDSYLQLVDLANLATVISLPPGYALALKSNLAVALKPYFAKAQLDPLVQMEAMKSLGNIKRTNIRTNVAVFDPEIVAHASATYNIYRDNNGS